MVRMVADGGNCCGLKHIYGFDRHPSTKLDKHKTGYKPDCTHGFGGDHGNRDKDAYHFDFPEGQTGEERLRDMMQKVADMRVYGLFQITLVDGFSGGSRDPDKPINEKFLALEEWFHQREWFPIVEDLGFKRVNRWYNSNSANFVVCYQLVTDEEWIKTHKTKKTSTSKKAAPFAAAS